MHHVIHLRVLHVTFYMHKSVLHSIRLQSAAKTSFNEPYQPLCGMHFIRDVDRCYMGVIKVMHF